MKGEDMGKKFFEHFLGKLRLSTGEDSTSLKREQVDSLREILNEINNLPPEQARYLAAFAFILFRVANADAYISDDETHEIENILQNWGRLSESQALLVSQIAKSQNILFGGTENFLVTREFKDTTTPEQRIHLLNCLFAVAASDDSISSIESDTIRIISKELGLEHQDFIQARQKFLDKLEALK